MCLIPPNCFPTVNPPPTPFSPAGFISQLGRAGAFNLSVSAWVPCGIMLTCLALTMAKDEDTMQVCVLGRGEVRAAGGERGSKGGGGVPGYLVPYC
jgi:hypothetical protein